MRVAPFHVKVYVQGRFLINESGTLSRQSLCTGSMGTTYYSLQISFYVMISFWRVYEIKTLNTVIIIEQDRKPL